MVHQNKKNIILIPVASTFVVLLTSIYIRNKRRRLKNCENYKDAKPPPYTKCSALETYKIISSKKFPKAMYQWSKDAGQVFRMNIPLSRYQVVVSGDPYLCREVLIDRTSHKTERIKLFRIVHDGGDDIFTSEGQYWKHSRKSIAPAFSNNHIKRMIEVVSKQTKTLMEKLDSLVESKESFDVGVEFIDLTLSVICDAAFEYKISAEEKEMFLEELSIAAKEAGKGRIPFRWTFGSVIPSVRRGRLAGKKLAAFGMKVLESYKKIEQPIKGTVIDLIVHNDEYKSDKERASDIIILLVGGHDTTAYTLAWTMLELAKNEEEQIKLQKDLRSRSESDRSNSEILNFVIKESFRLNPVAIGSARQITRDIIVEKSEVNGLEHDLIIEKGTVVISSQILMNRNPNYYEDPDVFKPSRWKNPSTDTLASFMPFSLGRRNCVGQSLAKSELVHVLSSLCSAYHFTVANEGTYDFAITIKPKDARLYVNRIDNHS